MVVPERISLARRRRGFTAAELAGRLDISPRRLTAFERGLQEPTASTLAAVSAELAFPESFFRAGAIPDLPSTAISFRTPGKIPHAKKESAASACTFAAEFASWLDRTFVLPVTDLPAADTPDPEVVAAMLRARWGLSDRPVTSMVHLLEAHGVRIFSLASEHREVGPHSFWSSSTPVAILDTDKHPEQRRFDAAHELGHLVLHSKRTVSDREAEEEADAFAMAFLMPEGGVRAQFSANPLVDEIILVAAVWHVPTLRLARRLRVLGLLDSKQYRSACVELSKRDRWAGHPSEPAQETSQLLGKAFGLLRKQGRGIRDIEIALHLHRSEILTMIFGLVVTAVADTTTVTHTTDEAHPRMIRPPRTALRMAHKPQS